MKKFSYIVLIALLTACESLLEVPKPTDEITNLTVFEHDATAIDAIRGIYAEMAGMPYFSNGSIAMFTGLSADELIPMNDDYLPFYQNALTPNDKLLVEYFWAPAYKYIYNANAAIEGIQASKGTSPELRPQLLGEAFFIRAFSHFYLTNIFGPVPFLTVESWEKNAIAPRTAQSVVYDMVAADLLKARDLLNGDRFAYSAAELGRIRVTTWAASALLSRVYLYQGKWALADEEATRVIEHNALFSLENIDSVFKATSREAIWQLKANTPGMGSWDAFLFMPTDGWLTVTLHPAMLNVFEAGDQRRKAWVDSLTLVHGVFYYPAKYKSQFSNLDEYHMELRLAELYLIRAEARVKLNDLGGAIADIDLIRSRAGLPLLAESNGNYTVPELIDAIVQERRVELFSESGHRWFDLIRHDRASAEIGILPDKVWQNTDIHYPVPQSEIDENSNLLPQNEGY